MKLILATKNSGKIDEIKKILSDLDIQILSAEEVGIKNDIVEDGKTFKENALKKASFVLLKTGEWTMADDSGICINKLSGLPGVKSARWTGKSRNGKEMVSKTLNKLKDIKSRQAYFECTVALINPKGKHWFFTGRIYGRVTKEPKGKIDSKLPYDVLFVPQGHKKTFAEMTK